jgi:hypothetical protein
MDMVASPLKLGRDWHAERDFLALKVNSNRCRCCELA